MDERFERAYRELIARAKEIALISSCALLLGWDEETNLPRGGARHRGEQQALLAGLEHYRAIDPHLGELLAECDASLPEGRPIEAANLKELRRRYERATRLPRSLVEALARTATLSQDAWLAAKEARRFGDFAPWLEQVVALKREEAQALSAGGELYDALLGHYEPNARWAELAPLFEALDQALGPLLSAGLAASGQESISLQRNFPFDRQRAFSVEVAERLGFNLSQGRIDTAAHPSTMLIGPGDCRITTWFRKDDLLDGFYSTLHEVGHGLYDQGLDPEAFGTPAGEAASLGLHESQSRLFENLIGRSRGFWTYFYPRAKTMFAPVLDDLQLDGFLSAIQRVAPGPIRFRADEITYNVHILIRVELERALLEGRLEARDLPAAWREAYRTRLGIVPADDAEGCLQDGHWASAMFGYFPTYTIGNLIAAQLYQAARRDLGNLDQLFAKGEFLPLVEWLRDRIHRHGFARTPADLVQAATGHPLSHEALVLHLHERYVLHRA